MTFQCRAVLHQLRKLSEHTNAQMSFIRGLPHIIRSDNHSKAYDYTEYQGEITGIIHALEKDGYLAYTINAYHFCLTDRGLHPYQYTYAQIKEFLFKSILVPIGVSIVTTLITLWIQHIFK